MIQRNSPGYDEITEGMERVERTGKEQKQGRAVKGFVASAFAVLLFLLASAPAAAAKPCWREVVDDWYNGRIDKVYPIKCYRDAMDKLGDDAKIYSTLEEDLNRALSAVLSRRGGNGDGGNRSVGPRSGNTRVPPGAKGRDIPERTAEPRKAAPLPGREEPQGFFGQVLGALGPNNADSVPLPLIFLAGLALLLMAAGGAGFVGRRIQARRAPVAPPPEQPRD